MLSSSRLAWVTSSEGSTTPSPSTSYCDNEIKQLRLAVEEKKQEEPRDVTGLCHMMYDLNMPTRNAMAADHRMISLRASK